MRLPGGHLFPEAFLYLQVFRRSFKQIRIKLIVFEGHYECCPLT